MMLLRYPGSKHKIASRIVAQFPDQVTVPLFQRGAIEYREPFLGGGAIAYQVLKALPRSARVWLNDADPGMCFLWNSVRFQPDELEEEIERFSPTVSAFQKFKEEDGRTDLDPVHAGFRKLALHTMSWGGLGSMAGGPLGGVNQSSEYNVDCRWRASRHRRTVRAFHRVLSRFSDLSITCKDFGDVITGAPEHAFVYADPPYFVKGPELYRLGMPKASDHTRLAELLRRSRASWVLSYDDHDFIRGLYDWAEIQSVYLTYTVAIVKGERRKNSEILIRPKADAAATAAE